MSWALGMVLRKERYSIGFGKRKHLFACYKKFIVSMKQTICGEQNGAMKLFSPLESNKAAVCFLFNNNFNFQFQRVYTDPARRFITCDIKVNEKPLTLANMYAPNEDNPSFFQSFLDHFVDFRCEDIIISGDFNLVMDQNSSKMS